MLDALPTASLCAPCLLDRQRKVCPAVGFEAQQTPFATVDARAKLPEYDHPAPVFHRL